MRTLKGGKDGARGNRRGRSRREGGRVERWRRHSGG